MNKRMRKASKGQDTVEPSDWDLVQQCQAGDRGAFQQLVSRYHQKVYMVVLGLLRNREDALEVSQETFFRAYRKIRGFHGGSSFYTWLYRIAVNLAIDEQRRQKRNPLDYRQNMDGLLEAQNEVARDAFADVRSHRVDRDGKSAFAGIPFRQRRYRRRVPEIIAHADKCHKQGDPKKNFG